MSTKPDIVAIRIRIEKEMERKGYKRRSLSAKAGLSESAVRDVLTRTDNPGIGTLHKIADALELSFDALYGAAAVPLAGQVGAGGLIAYFKDDHDFETVPRPPLSAGSLVAFEVAGDSMLPKYEAGDIVYVRREHDGVLPAYLNRYCAIHLADGGTYLKLLTSGSHPSRFTLRSLNAADMIDVEVLWASPVLFVMPHFARQQLTDQTSQEG